MGLGDRIGQWLGLVFVVAIIYMIVRPQSTAAQAVSNLGKMAVAMVRRATDLAAK